jgi:hypothetical protein
MKWTARVWPVLYAFGAFPAAYSAGANASGPAVFIGASKGEAWWIRKANVRPMGTSVEGIDLKALNAFRHDNETLADDFCFVEGAEPSSFVGIDRGTERDIRQTLTQNPELFRREFTTSDGRQFVARIALVEDCGSANGGSMLLVYEKPNRKIVLLRAWAGDPYTFLWPADAPGILGFRSCFECGDWNVIYYDASRRRFYSEQEGD